MTAFPAEEAVAPVVVGAGDVDAILAWFRGEFAAANAIIDALCGHLAEVGGGDGSSSEYEAVFTAVHRRRLNWIPILQMQKYYSIADVATELKRVAALKKKKKKSSPTTTTTEEEEKKDAKVIVVEEEGEAENGGEEVVGGGEEEEDSPQSDVTDAGSHEMQHVTGNVNICSNHEGCDSRPAQIKLTKGFTAKEHVKRHMVNVVKGLKLYEDVFTDSELSKLKDFLNELQVAGLNGELSGDTFISFNKQMKGIKKELIQFGIPIFGHIKEETGSNNETSDIEPIPALLQGLISHLVQWQLIPQYKRPNGCIIHYFDEDDYSQPFLKPPHLEQPISTLFLSESTMAFGRTLASDNEGNFRGPLKLSLKEGSLLVMRGNSADMARNVMCPSPNKRVSITFFRVRPDSYHILSPPTDPMDGAMTVFQPEIPGPYSYEPTDMTPKWGVLHAPVVMVAPVPPVVLSLKEMPSGGTGVFLPIGSGKPAKHLPPRAQRGRLLSQRPRVDAHVADSASGKT